MIKQMRYRITKGGKKHFIFTVINVVIVLNIFHACGQVEEYDESIDYICGSFNDHSSVIENAIIKENLSVALFLMNWTSSSSSLKLIPIMPNGTRVDKSLPFIENVRGDGFEYYSIQNPDAGLWSLEIVGLEVPEISEEYCLMIDLTDDMGGKENVIVEDESHFNYIIFDYGNDKNKNGLVESITINVGVSITKPGEYYLMGMLVNDSGEDVIFADDRTYLGIGAQSMMLNFYKLNTTGRRQLKNLTLYDSSGKLLDHIDKAHATTIYDKIEYQIPQNAYLNGDYSDHGTDVNNDNLFEFVTIDVGIDVLKPADYILTGSLYDLNGNEVVWSVNQKYLGQGNHTMHLDFDGDTIEKHGINGPYQLKDLKLSGRNWTLSDIASRAYNTSAYKFTDFMDPVLSPPRISGFGLGELLLTVAIKETLPVFSGRYNQDLIGIGIPPITYSWNFTDPTYEYNMQEIYIPKKPNDFNVTARGVKNLNIGLKKFSSPPEIANIANITIANITRTWITAQVDAKDDTAIASTDLISPGSYHVKIFGDAVENASKVDLELTVVKKIIVNGKFDFLINTTGFPAGNYSVNAKALNGSFKFDALNIDGI